MAEAVDSPEPELDTSFHESNVGFSIRIAQLKIFDDLIARLARLDLRPAEFSVLCLIGDNPGCRASQIAEYLWIKRPNFVPLLTRLEKRRFVRRRQLKSDRRIHELFLTRNGQEIAAQARRLTLDQEAHLTACLGEKQRDELLKTLEKIVNIHFSM